MIAKLTKCRWTLAIVPLLAIATPAAHAQTQITYADVAPIIAARCVMCHSGPTPPAGLSLESFDAVLKGGSKGEVVKPGAPAESELMRRIRGTSQPRMPMTGPPFLSDREMATFEGWIAGGLERGTAAAGGPPAATPPPRRVPGAQVTYLDVAPILAKRCAKCHADNGLMGSPPEGYRLTSYAATLTTTDRARVVPGNPVASELLRRVRGQARPRMPFNGPPYLDQEETRLIEDWIAQGARDARGTAAVVPVGAEVRLHGTLDSDARLDGLSLVFGPRTRIDRNLATGSYVEVRGKLDESGKVNVERMRSR